jgi:hypothetical protein
LEVSNDAATPAVLARAKKLDGPDAGGQEHHSIYQLDSDSGADWHQYCS